MSDISISYFIKYATIVQASTSIVIFSLINLKAIDISDI